MKTILAAEDDATARTVLKESLSEVAGWVVTAVEDGAKLLEALDTVKPHLIVLDVNMPGLDGVAVYRLLRERDDVADVPVLFVTAESAEQAAALDGPFRWLAKPYDVDDLLGAAAELMGVERPAVAG